MTFTKRNQIALFLFMGFATLFLNGCDSWVGEDEEAPLPGKRIPILSSASSHDISFDKDYKIDLSLAINRASWPNVGGSDDHAMGHLSGGKQFSLKWKDKIGSIGSDDKLLSPPISAEGNIFVLNSNYDVIAYNRKGQQIWNSNVLKESDGEDSFGGGMSYEDGKLYMTTGSANIIALNAQNGVLVWSRKISHPFRSAPIASQGRVFVVSTNSQVLALDATSGETLWTQDAFSEDVSLLNSAVPAISNNILFVAHRSGEIFAYRVENGQVLWIEGLYKGKASGILNTFSDIVAPPVIDGDVAFFVNHSSQISAVDVRTGSRIWEAPFGTAKMPWVVGNVIYLVTADSKLVCLSRNEGKAIWIKELRKFVDSEDKEGRIHWSGPILSGGRLLLTNSIGQANFYDPYTGEQVATHIIPEGVTLPSIIVDDVYYLLGQFGNLMAFESQ